MNFELTDEQHRIRELAHDFAEAEIAPKAVQWDREHYFPAEVFEKLGELGLMRVPLGNSRESRSHVSHMSRRH